MGNPKCSGCQQAVIYYQDIKTIIPPPKPKNDLLTVLIYWFVLGLIVIVLYGIVNICSVIGP